MPVNDGIEAQIGCSWATTSFNKLSALCFSFFRVISSDQLVLPSLYKVDKVGFGF